MADDPNTEAPMTGAELQQFRDDRRHMAWIALLSIAASRAVELSPLVPLDRLDKLADPTTWFYMVMASIVGAYFGVKAWTQVSKK